jgi:hypothetical protein
MPQNWLDIILRGVVSLKLLPYKRGHIHEKFLCASLLMGDDHNGVSVRGDFCLQQDFHDAAAFLQGRNEYPHYEKKFVRRQDDMTPLHEIWG